MTVKNKVLYILESDKGRFFSGQDLADDLKVSRTAIWKAINTLKIEGYQIISDSNKGYSLLSTSDLLSKEAISLYLDKEYKDIPIIVYKSIESTNTEAKLLAIQGAIHGTTVIAEEQTKGRGRFGRDFFSPAKTGIYMSIILKPVLNIKNSVLVTTAAAVAVCDALEDYTSETPMIKWVNDIFISDKKVCGILTEAVTNFESGTIDSIVLGIGINVKTSPKEFPTDLQSVAGSIFESNDSFDNFIRNQLAAKIINNVFKTITNLEDKSFMKKYKERSMVLGENILYMKNNSWHEAYALDIDDKGALVIYQEGQKLTLNSGEVSIRKK